MKRFFSLIIVILLSFICIANIAYADCSNEDLANLKKKAAKVKLIYETDEVIIPLTERMKADGATEPLTEPFFRIKVLNVSNNINFSITNNYNSDEKTVYGYNLGSEGTYEFEWNYLSKIVKFTYEVEGSSSSNCPYKELATGYLTTPKYNTFSDAKMCEGITDYKYCSKFVTFDVSYEDQYTYIQNYIAEKEAKEKAEQQGFASKALDYMSEHKGLFIGASAVIVLGGVAFVIIRNNRKRVK